MSKRQTIHSIRKMKEDGIKIPMVTVYDYPSSLIAEQANIDFLLVGDSLGMVVQGHQTTIPVDIDDMVRHTQAVVRGAQSALVVADLPFLSYATIAEATTSARRVMQEGGAQAVKIEGGREILPIMAHLTKAGIPVMGHLGMTPQSQHQIGLKVQAKTVAAAQELLEDAVALEAAGAFALVLELVPARIAGVITQKLAIPVIGIGAGPFCDGQVQVWHDLLGIFAAKSPRHAKRFAEIGSAMTTALSEYALKVREGSFPDESQSVDVSSDIVDALYSGNF